MRLGASLMLALLGTLVLVGSASAREPRAQAYPSVHQVSFDLPGSDGYQIEFSAGHGTAQLFVSKHATGLFNSAVAFYSTRSRLRGSRIEADFGRFGRVSGVFEQRGQARHQPPAPECEGGGPVRRLGRFAGTAVFHGEGGYTEARASSAKAEVTDVPPLRCHGFGHPPHEGKVVGQGTSLRTSCANPSFFASTEGLKGEVLPPAIPTVSFSASISERVGSVRIIRLASAGGKAPTFLFDQALSSATVSPPPPFSGSATFTRGPAGETWSGDLAVDFPGASVGLVRPNSGVDLTHFPVREQTGLAVITVERCKGRR